MPPTITAPVEEMGPWAVVVKLPVKVVAAKRIALVSLRMTLPAVKPTIFKSVSVRLRVTSPVPTLMLVVPRTITLPSILVTLRSELALMVKPLLMVISATSIAPETAPAVGPLWAIVKFWAVTCPTVMLPD